jgi:hypothetical protein
MVEEECPKKDQRADKERLYEMNEKSLNDRRGRSELLHQGSQERFHSSQSGRASPPRGGGGGGVSAREHPGSDIVWRVRCVVRLDDGTLQKRGEVLRDVGANKEISRSI